MEIQASEWLVSAIEWLETDFSFLTSAWYVLAMSAMILNRPHLPTTPSIAIHCFYRTCSISVQSKTLWQHSALQRSSVYGEYVSNSTARMPLYFPMMIFAKGYIHTHNIKFVILPLKIVWNCLRQILDSMLILWMQAFWSLKPHRDFGYGLCCLNWHKQ